MKKFFVSAIAILVCLLSFDLIAECTGLSFDPAMAYGEEYDDSGNVTGYYPNTLESYELTGFSDEYQGGYIAFEFYPSAEAGAAVGTYDLATGGNDNYSTCNQCVRLYRFVYDATTQKWNYDTQFFQQQGTLQVTKTDFSDEDLPYYEGVVSVTLAEVTIAGADEEYASTFVTNGECYEIQSAAFSNFPEDTGDTGDTGDTEVPGDTGDTEVPGDTGDTEVPGDTGDTGSDPVDTGDTGDTEVPGDTGDTEAPADDTPADTGSEPADTDDTQKEEPAKADDSKDDDSDGCSLVLI